MAFKRTTGQVPADKAEHKQITYGSLNTYKAANGIDDDESTIARNLFLDKIVGEISSWGPWSTLTYAGSITSFFHWEGFFFVQVGVSLYKGVDLLTTLDAGDKLYYLPFTDVVGNSFLLFTNQGGSYKYNGTTVTKLGLAGPVTAPTVDVGEDPEIYRKPLLGVWGACRGTEDANNVVRTSQYGSISYGTNNYGSSFPIYAMTPRGITEEQEVELLIGASKTGVPIYYGSLAKPIPLFYLKVDLTGIDMNQVSKLVLNLTSNILFRANEFVVQLSTLVIEPNNIFSTPDNIINIGTTPSAVDELGVIKSIPVAEGLTNDGNNLLNLDISDMTLVQKNSIKTIFLAVSDTYAEYWRIAIRIATTEVKGYNFPDVRFNINFGFLGTESASLGKINGEGYAWIYTYVNSTGSESIASPPSDTSLEKFFSQVAMVTVEASLDTQIASINLYRVGGVNTLYRLVDNLPNEDQTITDDKADSELGIIYNGDLNIPATTGLKGLINHLNRVFAYKGNEVQYSEPNNPEYWGNGLSNKIKVGDNTDIFGIASFGKFLYVLKADDKAYIITQLGEGVFEVENISIPDGIGTPDAILGEVGAIYLGNYGIYQFVGVSTKDLSLAVKNKFVNTSGFLFKAGSRIISTNPPVIINNALNTITEFDLGDKVVTYAGAFIGKIFFGCEDGTIIYEDDEGTDFPFDLIYQSKEFEFGFPQVFKYLRRAVVEATVETGAELTIKIYADGVLKKERGLLTGRNIIGLPNHAKGKKLQFKIEGTGKVAIKTPTILLESLPVKEQY